MARILILILVAAGCLGCAHEQTSAPEYDLCWTLFPPGPEFDQKIREYSGTSDADAITAGCLPTYRLDAETCARFFAVGAGQWPHNVVQWCQKYGVQLQIQN